VAERQGALEAMVTDRAFWRGRRVFLTGHTGFKGAWMSLLLGHMGADVHGYALAPEEPSVFETCGVAAGMHHQIGDVRDASALQRALAAAKPDIVIHMAAQSLVRRSYADPVETFAVNVMGTVNVLEAIRHVAEARAAVIVTSDKCYENYSTEQGYREIDALGGHDPYSSSKGCAEIVTAAYRRSFFSAGPCAIASARAGNVIGGGDWATDRLVPDAMRAFAAGQPLRIRNPDAVRPWQHVLDPILAYLLLAQRLVERGNTFAEGWNFGPDAASELPVAAVVERLTALWGDSARWERDAAVHPHEAALLTLDCTKAKRRLGWRPLIAIDDALSLAVSWYRARQEGRDMRSVTLRQIEELLQPT
jgi:CDP-glucose 4,6-dehydratase